MIGCPITGSGLPADVKDHHTSTRGKPLLDERTFQQLLAAAYLLQQHYDHLLARALKATYAQTLSDGAIVEKVRPPTVSAANMSVSLPTQPDTWLQIRPLDGSDRPAFTGKLGSICLKARIAEALVVTDNSVLGDDIGFAALSRLETI
jgi:hypothetical protein